MIPCSIFLPVWLISLCIMSSSSIHVVTDSRMFSLNNIQKYSCLNDIPFYIYHIFFVHLYCFQVLAVVNSAFWWTREYRYRFEILFSSLLDPLPELRLLNHVIALFLIFWGTSILLSVEAVPIYIRINSAKKFLFSHILTNTYLLCFKE